MSAKYCGKCGRELQVLFHVERYCPSCECPPKPIASQDFGDEDTVELCPRCHSEEIEPFYIPGRPLDLWRCVPCGHVWR